MKTLRVMDSSGDRAVTFDETQAESAAYGEAEALFERLGAEGATAFAVNREGGAPDKLVRRFGELEQENLIVPRIVGG